jgi:hypothetical protein
MDNDLVSVKFAPIRLARYGMLTVSNLVELTVSNLIDSEV